MKSSKMTSERRNPLGVQHHSYTHHAQSAVTHIAVEIDDQDVNIRTAESQIANRIEDTELYQLLTPFLAWMRICGALFSHKDDNAIHERSFGRQFNNTPTLFLEACWLFFVRYGKQWSLYVGYSMLFSMGTLSVYFVLCIHEFTLEMIFFIMFVFICLLLGMIGVVVYYRFNITGKMLLLFQKYSNLQMSVSDKKILASKIRNLCMLITKIYITEAVITVIGAAFVVYTAYEERSEVLIIYYFLQKLPYLLNRFFFYATFLVVLAIVNLLCVHTGFIVLVSFIMFTIFKQFNGAMDSDLCEEDDLNGWSERRGVDSINCKFQRIVEMVDAFDDAIGIYFIPFVVLIIMNLSLIIYFVLFFCSDNFTEGVFISWIFFTVGIGMSVLLSAAMMNSMAMRSYRTLHEMDISNLSSSSVMKLLVLMNSVSRPIGITAMGFFTVTKTYIISLVATFFSYFFVLIEFSPSASMCKASNSTENLQ